MKIIVPFKDYLKKIKIILIYQNIKIVLRYKNQLEIIKIIVRKQEMYKMVK